MINRLVLTVLLLVSFSLNASNFSPPDSLWVVDIDYNEATLKWSDDDDAMFWLIAYNVSLNPNIDYAITNADSLKLNALISGAAYNWKVAMIDQNGDTTDWSSISTFITPQPESLCPGLTQLQIENMTNSGINVQWVPESGATEWEVVYGPLGSNPDFDGGSIFTENHNVLISNLFIGSWYQIAVRGVCVGANSPWSIINVKYTPEQNYILPVQESFEDEYQMDNFGFISGNINPWVIGSAYNATTDGENSIYVSTTSGLSNEYYPNKRTISYSYIDVFIPSYATSFYLDFRWKGMGEGENDGLKVYLMSPNSSLDIDSLPHYSNRIGENIYSGNNDEWNNEHIEIPADFVGEVRRLVFAWINDSSLGGESSIIVDDIYITARYCAMPTNLRTGYLSYYSCELIWDFAYGQDIFNLQYRKAGETEWTEIRGVNPGYLLEELEDNTDYYYRVQTDCIMEESFWSEPDSFRTNLLCLPPYNIRSEDYMSNYGILEWDVADNIDRCILEYGVDNGENTNFSNKIVMGRRDSLSNLYPDTEYLIRMKAISNQDDTSQYSEVFRLNTLCDIIEAYPYDTYLDSIFWDSDFNTQLAECWRETKDTVLLSPYFNFSNLGFPVLSLDFIYADTNHAQSKLGLYSSTDGENFSLVEYINPSPISNGSKTIELSDLRNLSKVRLALILTSTSNSWSRFSIKNFVIRDKCKTPEDLALIDLDYSSVSIEWTGFANNHSWDTKLIDLSNNDSIVRNVNTHPIYFDNLIPNNDYRFMIRANCGIGFEVGDWESIEFRTLDDMGPCPRPSNFEGEYVYNSSSDEHSIHLSWDDSEHNEWILDYKLKNAYEWNKERILIVNQYAIRDVPYGFEYLFRLRTVCSLNDTSSWTEIINVVASSSLDEIGSNMGEIEIYPNPASSMVEIRNIENIEKIRLIDNKGIKLMETRPRQEIDISSYPSGNYYLQFVSKHGVITRKLLIWR